MPVTLTTGQFQTLTSRIAEYSGFALDGSRHRSLENALATRLEQLNIGDVRTYLQQLDTAELHRLTELVVNHETQFFRTPAHYRALRQEILPTLHRSHPAGLPLTLWSAGCATGDEPYSLAISALEALGDPLPRSVVIHATDISHQAIAKAQAGRYRGRALLNVAPEELARRFALDHGWHTVQPDVRALVTFEQHNLHTAFPAWARKLDIIFCQNVTIYFSVEDCKALIERFFDALVPGGYLFLGYSETLWRIFDRFETVEIAGAFAYRKPLARPPTVPKPRTLVKPKLGTRELHPPATLRRPLRSTGMLRTPQANQTALFEEGVALLRSGQLDEALATLQQIRSDQPQYPQALAAIARIHANRGAWELAAAEARRALELDVLTADAHLLLGMLNANQERWTDAAAHLERVRYLQPNAPLPSFHLANVYRAQGRHEFAEREYRSTMRKLTLLDDAEELDGVTVGWLRETCGRYLHQLEADRRWVR